MEKAVFTSVEDLLSLYRPVYVPDRRRNFYLCGGPVELV